MMIVIENLTKKYGKILERLKKGRVQKSGIFHFIESAWVIFHFLFFRPFLDIEIFHVYGGSPPGALQAHPL